MPENSVEKIIKKIPDDIISVIINGKTSIGNNPAIPDIPGTPYLEELIRIEWNYSLEKLKQLHIDSDTDLVSTLSNLIIECQSIEKPYRQELEILCTNKVNELFNPPKDYVETDFSLVDSLSLEDQSIILEPIDGDCFRFDSYDEAAKLKPEVYKRRFMDMLCMGAGLSFSSVLNFYSDEIYDLNPRLVYLYDSILTINAYLLLCKNDLNIDDRNNRLIGANIVRLGADNDLVKITAQGKIFPILLAEAIRGFMGLFASHGLPKDLNKSMLIINKSDFIKAEPWDMRIGPMLWKILYRSFKSNDTETIPYLFKKISQLKPNAFFMFMREVLLNSEKGDALISIIRKRAEKEMQEDDFAKKAQKNTDLPVISDDISPMEF